MKRMTSFILFGLLVITPSIVFGQSDLFEIRTPNVLIIFDTSSSMNMNPDGAPVGAGLAIGVDGQSRVYEGGGDHPQSKLFMAKQALRSVISGLESVNLGFATYGQRRQEKWRGLFRTCKAAIPDRKWCEKRYWRWVLTTGAVDGPKYANDFSANSFQDFWGTVHKGVSVGYRFKRTQVVWDKDGSTPLPPHSNLKKKNMDLWYEVKSITYIPEYNYYQYKYQSDPYDYYTYEEKVQSIENCNSCGSDKEKSPFPRTWTGGFRTYFAGEDEYENPYGGDSSKKNWWSCVSNLQVGKPPCWDYEYSWRTYSGPQGTACKTQGPYEYVGPCYEVSVYYYPIGSSPPALPFDPVLRPHTWSYFKIKENGWPESNQPAEYYPARTGIPEIDNNNFFFINFPEIDDSLNNYQTREQIKTLLDLTPVENPETKKWHTKLPVKTGSVTSNTIESPYTPLADSLRLARKYFGSYIFTYKGGDAPTQANCRGNYIILLTDGLESARFKDGQPDYDAAPEEARALYELVKDKHGKPCGVKTYVIGFGKGLGDNLAVLNTIAEKGGTGKAYLTDNVDNLKNAFQEIFEAIKDNYSRSNPVIAKDGKSMYKGYLSFPGWNGHLLKYEVDKIDEAKNILRYEDRTWDAGQLMNAEGRGPVYTWTQTKFEPTEVDFVTLNAGMLASDLNRSPEIDINEDGKKDNQDAQTIISFILDPGLDDGKYKGARSGNWKLGDIYHSTPLVVGPPSMNIPDNLFPKKYSKFREDQKNRPTMVYVGANDGMLHAFGEDGKERFAVIPKNLLGKLRDLRSDHQFFVDSSPRAYDVYFSNGKDEWKTVLVNGLRGGGNHYFAVDVTDPDNPNVLWEQTDSRMGYTWSRPEIGRVRLGGKEKFLAFVGGGYSDPNDPTFDNIGNTFYVIDIEEEDSSKRILRRFDVGGKSNKVPGGATAFDRDFDGRVDAVYFGDLQGVLWKIKIDGQEDVKNWQLVKLFQSDGNLPIFYPPAVTKNNQGKVLVYFGQGDELNLFEKTSTNSFYEIWDKGTEGEKVWRKQLRPGEKVLSAPLIDNNTVYFTTWEYTGIEGECGKGMGRLYGLTTTREGKTGGLAGLTILNTETNLWKPPVESLGLGRGIPTAPIIVVRGKRQWMAYSSSVRSDEVRLIGPIPGGGRARLKSWREVF